MRDREAVGATRLEEDRIMAQEKQEKIVAGEWEKFWKAVKPEGAPKVQHDEMRRAFYAGFHCLLNRIAGLFDSDSDEPTEADLAIMGQIDAELKAFQKDIAEGRA